MARKHLAQDLLMSRIVEIHAKDFRLRRPQALGIQLGWIDDRGIEMAVRVRSFWGFSFVSHPANGAQHSSHS